MKQNVIVGNQSDVGKVRKVNEDYFGEFKGHYGHLVVVCDGMGGHKGGFEASRLSVSAIKQHFEGLPKEFNPKQELRTAIIAAADAVNRKANEDVELKEMGSTAVVLLFHSDRVFYAHIGDSRIYMIRDRKIHRLTKDHSLVQQMVDAGMITEEAAETHPKRNVISRSIGAGNPADPEVSDELFIFKGDKFLLCTDGLTGYVKDEELLQVVLKSKNEIESCGILVDMANERGGKDNITVQIASVVRGKSRPIVLSKKEKQISVLAALVIVLFATVGYLYFSGALQMLIPEPNKTEVTTPKDSTNNSTKPDSTNKEPEKGQVPETGSEQTNKPAPANTESKKSDKKNTDEKKPTEKQSEEKNPVITNETLVGKKTQTNTNNNSGDKR